MFELASCPRPVLQLMPHLCSLTSCDNQKFLTVTEQSLPGELSRADLTCTHHVADHDLTCTHVVAIMNSSQLVIEACSYDVALWSSSEVFLALAAAKTCRQI